MAKSCSVCGVLKPLTEFSPRGAMRDGHRSDCKKCCCAKAKAAYRSDPAESKARCQRHYLKHRDQRIAATQRWYAENTERALSRGRDYQRVTAWHISMAHRCKAVAKNRGCSFDLDADFLEALFARQNGRCHWLGIEMQPSIETRNPLQPSVDRLDCSKGYTKDNVVLACQFANMGRSAMSAERFQAFVTQLETHFVDKAIALSDPEGLLAESVLAS